MSKFGHLKKLHVATDKTVDLRLSDLPGEPVLQVLPALEQNKRYFRELLKRRPANVTTKKKLTAESFARDRDEDREMYPDLVIRGWKGIVGADGKEVPFSKEDCADFLANLADDLFDEIRKFVNNPSNFREATFDVEEVAKNS